ncbi:MAG TPA: hypothetical protein VH518_14840 [Tepidisphaeraceae bacterium]|jgi:hypothetical protein
MNSKSLSIAVLSITAVILFVAQFIPVQPAAASQFSIKDRGYAMVTSISQKGGDIIFVSDNRTGQIAVFAWDPSRRALVVRAVGALSDAFK